MAEWMAECVAEWMAECMAEWIDVCVYNRLIHSKERAFPGETLNTLQQQTG